MNAFHFLSFSISIPKLTFVSNPEKRTQKQAQKDMNEME